MKTSERFGEYLVRKGLVSQDELDKALRIHKDRNKRLGETLVELGILHEKSYLEILGEYIGIPFITLKDFPQDIQPPVELSPEFMRQYRIFPLELSNGDLKLAMVDPLDLYTIDDIETATGLTVKPVLCLEKELMSAIENYASGGASQVDKIVDDMTEEELSIYTQDVMEDEEMLRDMASEAPVIKLVNLMIQEAVERDASDIHIEPFENALKVRYRIDGILHDVEAPPKKIQAAVISRIKLMAQMNIAERRLPQDGRIMTRAAGKKIDMRVSTVPTLHGESVVMRILDQSSSLLTLQQLGFEPDHLQKFQNIIVMPHGIFLVTGPTGSGKTTTLYAALDKINSPEKKIITIEEPVEYQLMGVNQIQVRNKIGLTFAKGLRHIVRQDPDIIMVGEIRDLETADIAVHAALTGHLVFSTLHTNDACGAITRLMDMGIENYLVSSVLVGVLAQRLVRVLCPHCKEAIKPSQEVLSELELHNDENEKIDRIYQAVGCEKCNHTGYKGRKGIFELLVLNDEIHKLIMDKAPANIIKRRAREQGMRTLRQDGWAKVRQGITTIEEVFRVTQEEETIAKI